MDDRPRDTVVVVPCYNERARLRVEPFRSFVAAHPDCALTFVDDGSTDGTGDLLRTLADESPGCRCLALDRNSGKAEAVRRGVLDAIELGAAFVGYWDADLATPLDDAPRFRDYLRARPELTAVIGSRVHLLGRRILRNPARHYVGRLFATGAALALGFPVYDTQCGAKLFRVNDEVRAAFAAPFGDRWTFDVELLLRLAGRASDPGGVIHEWPLQSWEDRGGSKVRLVDGVRAWWSLVRIWASRGGR